MINLIVAVLWLVIAVPLLILSWTNPEILRRLIPGVDFSMGGWFALCLCLYNVVRWWTTRRSTPDRTLPRAAPARRRYYDEESGPQAPREEFRFTEQPPLPPGNGPDPSP